MFLGQCLIPVQENYNHLGVIVDHKCGRLGDTLYVVSQNFRVTFGTPHFKTFSSFTTSRLSTRITEACNKGRKSYYALSDLGSQFLNPKT